MGVLHRLFGGPSDVPAEWTELWELLRPLDGSLTVETAADWVEQQRDVDQRRVARALRQLKRSYAILDTEEHGRALRDHPFTAIGAPFARRRFIRVVDRVILAGPDAVERVAAEPVRIRVFDTVPLLRPDEFLDDSDVVETSLYVAMVQASIIAGTTEELDPDDVWDMPEWSHGWPSLADLPVKTAIRQEFVLDPEVSWLEINTYYLGFPELTPEEVNALDDEALDSFEDEDEDEDSMWGRSVQTALVRLLSALGPTPLEGEAGLPDDVIVILSRASAPATEHGDAYVQLTGPELALGTEPERADLVTRRVARALADLSLPWSARSREELGGLADGA